MKSLKWPGCCAITMQMNWIFKLTPNQELLVYLFVLLQLIWKATNDGRLIGKTYAEGLYLKDIGTGL